MPPPTAICQHCGNKFTDKDYRKPKYCSFECYNATRKKPARKACLYCGEIFFTVDDRKKYCNRACYDNHRQSKANYTSCEICSKSFYDYLNSRRFCSKECRLKSGWTEPDPDKRDIFTCEWCGKEFENWVYRQNRFCSKRCAAEYGGSVGGRPKNPEIHITLECDYCGKPYETTTHQVRLRGSRFCSIECRGAMRSIEFRGENNHNWTGGSLELEDYGSNWQRQARRAKKRDKHTCQVCGYQSGGDRILDVHHIVPLKEFDEDWNKANRLKNLISLCRQCHVKVEKGKIPCQPRLPALAA